MKKNLFLIFGLTAFGVVAVVLLISNQKTDTTSIEPELNRESAIDDKISPRERQIQQAMPDADIEQVQSLITESDRINATVAEHSSRQTRFLLHAMERLPVSEEEARAFHKSNPEVFGTRSFEDSQMSIERILRARMIRDANIPPEESWEWGPESDFVKSAEQAQITSLSTEKSGLN